MTGQSKPEKIAILGGGIAGLVTAFELTRDKDWKDKFDITIHQLGWRLGGKCASSRAGAEKRIEEHGIHAFLGDYFNALPLMAECYAELATIPGGHPLSFEDAFKPGNFAVLWEWQKGRMLPWPQSFVTNSDSPKSLPPDTKPFDRAIKGVISIFEELALDWPFDHLPFGRVLKRHLNNWVRKASASQEKALTAGPDHPLVAIIDHGWRRFAKLIYPLIEDNDEWRRTFFAADFSLTLVYGALKENVASNGYDHLNQLNWDVWLARHGAHPKTIASPVAFNHPNITFQIRQGDASQRPQMAAGVYLRWCLQSLGYMGSFFWHFSGGTGEIVIAPLYLVLKHRGVKFAFFHKVEALRLSADKKSIAEVDITVQANLASGVTDYDPIVREQGMAPYWPDTPKFAQLVEHPQLLQHGVNLESYWSGWKPPNERAEADTLILRAGKHFDRLVFAISLGAVPYLCEELLVANKAWRDMVDNIPTIATRGVQIWLSRSWREIGWDQHLSRGDFVIGSTFANPHCGHADFSKLLAFEHWPEPKPQSFWYFCGPLDDVEPVANFNDAGYPARQVARVKAQAIQFLQAVTAPLMPGATTAATDPPGDAFGLNFDLLVDRRPNPGVGVARFDDQFLSANINPTERYVTSPPGSIQYRLKAWESGFDNLVIAGDWIDTGINVGSVEGTVMSGKLAARTVTAASAGQAVPNIQGIIGYPW